MIYWADKGFSVRFDRELHRTRTSHAAEGRLLFPSDSGVKCLNAIWSGENNISPFLKMPILIGKYLLTGSSRRAHAHAQDF